MTFSSLARFRTLPALVAVLSLVACDNPVGDDGEDEHVEEVAAVALTTHGGEPLANFADGVWSFTSGDAIRIGVGEDLGIRVLFAAADGDRFELPPSGDDHTLGVEIANTSVVTFVADGDLEYFRGTGVGTTGAVLQVVHGGHADFATAPLPIVVVAE